MGHKNLSKISAAGLLITLGIIYGDIGTSPLYVLKAIVGEKPIDSNVVLGAISCIIWTLTLQTTLKYVILTLRADNKGEGGIFSLYALVRRYLVNQKESKPYWKVMIYLLAMVGGSALLADGIITPPISVASAIEGLRIYRPEIQTVPIVIGIIVFLFLLQQFGTNFVGKSFGPIMMVWFATIAIIGIPQIASNLVVLKAFSPYYAYNLLVNYPGGFWLLGAVFLCTTGAEALYSDLGHCGRSNIRVTWIFVKTCLVLNYLGQGAFLINHQGQLLAGANPFFMAMPEWFVIPGIVIATLAAIIASQALITGSYTLISEAMRMNFWPKVKLHYPTFDRGQMYVPSINWLLMIGCIGVVLLFKESSNMEAAYGLSITITMLMTTLLLSFYLRFIRVPNWITNIMLALYLFIEGSFLIANLLKFTHGGWFTLLIGGTLFAIMYSWFTARKIKNSFTEFEPLQPFLDKLKDLSEDQTVPKYATHLVYLTGSNQTDAIETKTIYSILNKRPKRADVYWFVHVEVLDEPRTMDYTVETLVPEHVIRIEFRLGFKIEPKINLFLKEVISDLVERKEIDILSRYDSLRKHNITGDFSFVVIDRVINNDKSMGLKDRFIMNFYEYLKQVSLDEVKAFGLDTSLVAVENVPLVLKQDRQKLLKRVN